MKFPKLTELNTTRSMIDVFRGYNHNLRIGEGEFYDMTNLTSSDYPVLSPRSKRGTYAENAMPQGLISKDSLCYVDNGVLYINKKPITNLYLGKRCDGCANKGGCDKYIENSSALCEKTLISMGAYIIIMPDKKYINTEKLTDFGDIEASFTTETEKETTFSPCKADGSVYIYEDEQDKENAVKTTTSSTAPTTPNNLDLWIDTSTVPASLKQYAESKEEWIPLATSYTRITHTDIGKSFKAGDAVTISGLEDSIFKDYNTTMVIQASKDNYIVVIGTPFLQTTKETITIERRMPKLDFITESENRLWGCRYGVARNGEVVNEIYASKLGDFKNWNCFEGISTDSYVASVGTDGQFTGATTHLGYPIFFKENHMHKIYGNYPANFQIQTTDCRGVQKGSHKSIATVNEVLYYKSRSAICSYDGSLPVEISSALGDESYSNAVAGAFGNKYYISMADQAMKHHLFVYDTQKGMWHKEDNTNAREFCNCRGNLYYIDGTNIKSVLPETEEDKNKSPDFTWMAETGIMGTDSPDKKYISRLDVRMSLDVGTYVYFYIQYDSSEEWEHVYTMAGHTLRSFSVPIKPKRCDHLQLRIVGEGNAKIYSICKTIEQGSDI